MYRDCLQVERSRNRASICGRCSGFDCTLESTASVFSGYKGALLLKNLATQLHLVPKLGMSTALHTSTSPYALRCAVFSHRCQPRIRRSIQNCELHQCTFIRACLRHETNCADTSIVAARPVSPHFVHCRLHKSSYSEFILNHKIPACSLSHNFSKHVFISSYF